MWGIRHVGGEFGDTLYAEYQAGNLAEEDFTEVDFVEYFNLTEDSWAMDNLRDAPGAAAAQQKLHAKLLAWYACSGDSCP